MTIRTIILLTAALIAIASPISAQAAPGLDVGSPAPAFSLADADGKKVSLSELLKKGNTALVFHRSADW